jgi:hypothetical protein
MNYFLGSVNNTIGMTGMFTINTISPTKKDCEAMPKTKGIRIPVMQTTIMRYFFRDMSGCFNFKDDAKVVDLNTLLIKKLGNGSSCHIIKT